MATNSKYSIYLITENDENDATGDDHDQQQTSTPQQNSISELLRRAFASLRAHRFEPKYVKQSDVEIEPNALYVMERFEGEVFRRLEEAKSRVISPLVVLYCDRKKKPSNKSSSGEPIIIDSIPLRSHPVYSQCMRSIIVTCSNLTAKRRREIDERTKLMGGFFITRLNSETKYLISNSVLTRKYQAAVLLRIPVMHPDWIDKCWTQYQHEMRLAADPKIVDRHRLPIFYGLTITVSNINFEERTSAAELITQHGGTYSPSLRFDNPAIILLLRERIGNKYLFARKKRIPCLRYEWLSDSIATNYALSIEDYTIDFESDDNSPSNNNNNEIKATKKSIETSTSTSSEAKQSSTTIVDLETELADRLDELAAQHCEKNADDNDNGEIDWEKSKNFMKNIVLLIAGFTPIALNSIRNVARLCGALVVREHRQSTNISHMIVGPAYSPVGSGPSEVIAGPSRIGDPERSAKMAIVTANWLIDSLRSAKCVDVDPYRYDRNAATGPSDGFRSKLSLHPQLLDSANQPDSQREPLGPEELQELYLKIKRQRVDKLQQQEQKMKNCSDLNQVKSPIKIEQSSFSSPLRRPQNYKPLFCVGDLVGENNDDDDDDSESQWTDDEDIQQLRQPQPHLSSNQDKSANNNNNNNNNNNLVSKRSNHSSASASSSCDEANRKHHKKIIDFEHKRARIESKEVEDDKSINEEEEVEVAEEEMELIKTVPISNTTTTTTTTSAATKQLPIGTLSGEDQNDDNANQHDNLTNSDNNNSSNNNNNNKASIRTQNLAEAQNEKSLQLQQQQKQTLENLSSSEKPKIFMFSGFQAEKESLTRRVIDRLKVRVIDSSTISDVATHLILREPYATEKTISAIAAGLWILKREYIEDSLAAGRLLPESRYEWSSADFDVISNGNNNQKRSIPLNPRLLSSIGVWRRHIAQTGHRAFHRWTILVMNRTDPMRSTCAVLAAGQATALHYLDDYLHRLPDLRAILPVVRYAIVDLRFSSSSPPPEFRVHFLKIAKYLSTKSRLLRHEFISRYIEAGVTPAASGESNFSISDKFLIDLAAITKAIADQQEKE